MADKKDNTVILPTGQSVGWNDWVVTDLTVVPKQVEPPEDDEKKRMREFFFPRGPQPENGTNADFWRRQGKCPLCGELGRIHMSTMICSQHGPYF